MSVASKLRVPIAFIAGFLVGGGFFTSLADVDESATQTAVAPVPEPTTSSTAKRTTTTRPRTSTTSEPALGERRNPYAFGDSVVLSRGDQDYWEVRVLDFVADAAEEVAAENPFNEPPADGRQFALVTIEVTYLGPDEPTTVFGNLEFGAVDDSNVAYDFDDDRGIIPGRIDEFGDLYRGGTVTGNICWEVRSDSIESLLLTVGAPSADRPPAFMALR